MSWALDTRVTRPWCSATAAASAWRAGATTTSSWSTCIGAGSWMRAARAARGKGEGRRTKPATAPAAGPPATRRTSPSWATTTSSTRSPTCLPRSVAAYDSSTVGWWLGGGLGVGGQRYDVVEGMMYYRCLTK